MRSIISSNTCLANGTEISEAPGYEFVYLDTLVALVGDIHQAVPKGNTAWVVELVIGCASSTPIRCRKLA